MTPRKQITVSLSGVDLAKFNDIGVWLKEKNIETKDAEILRIALRGFHADNIKKELRESLDSYVPQTKKED